VIWGKGIVIRALLVGIGLWRGGLCNMDCMKARERRGAGIENFLQSNSAGDLGHG